MFQEKEEHVQRSCDRIDRGWYRALKEGSMAGRERVRGKTGRGTPDLPLTKVTLTSEWRTDCWGLRGKAGR